MSNAKSKANCSVLHPFVRDIKPVLIAKSKAISKMKMKKAKKRGEGSNFVGVYLSYARYKKDKQRKRWGLMGSTDEDENGKTEEWSNYAGI